MIEQQWSILNVRMRKFEIACYYDRPILPAQLPAKFSAAQAVKADHSGQSGIRERMLFRVF